MGWGDKDVLIPEPHRVVPALLSRGHSFGRRYAWQPLAAKGVQCSMSCLGLFPLEITIGVPRSVPGMRKAVLLTGSFHLQITWSLRMR